MNEDKQFTAWVWKNKANGQFSLQLRVKELSPELLKLFNGHIKQKVRLQIVEEKAK